MPNSYAVVPNIIPGSVTIGGDLTVQGNTIRVGAASPFTRLQKLPAGGGFLTYNVDRITTLTDQAIQNIWLDILGATARPFQVRFHDGTGGQNLYELPMVGAWSFADVSVTGTVAETDLFRTTFRGGLLGPNGGLRLWIAVLGNVQGATASTFRLKFNATTVQTITKTAIANIVWDWSHGNAGVQTTQSGWVIRVDSVAGQALASANSTESTNLNFDVALTIQPGATTDSWTRRGVYIEPWRSSN